MNRPQACGPAWAASIKVRWSDPRQERDHSADREDPEEQRSCAVASTVLPNQPRQPREEGGGDKIELQVDHTYQMKIIKLSPSERKIGLSQMQLTPRSSM